MKLTVVKDYGYVTRVKIKFLDVTDIALSQERSVYSSRYVELTIGIVAPQE
jgi:hypothetical protein